MTIINPKFILINDTRKIKNIHSLSKTAAAPIPVPMHIETTPVFSLVLSSSWNRVTIILAPVIPKGCPKAIAPPLLLSFSFAIYNVSIL
jgi:hypothetical protein